MTADRHRDALQQDLARERRHYEQAIFRVDQCELGSQAHREACAVVDQVIARIEKLQRELKAIHLAVRAAEKREDPEVAAAQTPAGLRNPLKGSQSVAVNSNQGERYEP